MEKLRIASMNRLGFLVVALILLMIAIPADVISGMVATATSAMVELIVTVPIASSPVLVVSGTAYDDEGTPLGSGLTVQVSNAVRQLSVTGTTDSSGQYAVTLVNIDPAELVAAAAGETISVGVYDATGTQIGIGSHVLTDTDIAVAHIVVDTHPPEPQQPIAVHFTEIGGKAAAPEEYLVFEVEEGVQLRLELAATGGGSGNELIFGYESSSLPIAPAIQGNMFTWMPGYDVVPYNQNQNSFNLILTVTDGTGKAEQPIQIQAHHVSNTASVEVVTDDETLSAGSTTRITVTLRDAAKLPVSDDSVTLTSNRGSLSEVTNNGDGTFIAVYTADTEPGEATITATAGSGVSGNVIITFDTAKPEVISVSVEPEIAKVGDIMVSIVLTEQMDENVEPSVVFVPAGSGRSIALTGKYEDDQTWRGTGSITEEMENGPAKIVISGAQDLAGNGMDLYEKMDAFVIDTIPPGVGQASVVIEDGAEYINATSLDFTFGGFTDESGIEGYYYSLTDGSGTPDGSYTQELSGNVTAEGDEVTVYVWARDRAGNIGDAVHDSIRTQATLSISTPTASQILPAGTTFTTLTVSIGNHEGAWHWKLNEPFATSGSAGGNSVESGNVVVITGLEDGQTYTVYVTLVDEEGNVLTPAVTENVTFSMASTPQPADFVISAVQSEITAKAGESAGYVIVLEGENGFSGEVILYASEELPAGVEAVFDPKKVTLSEEDTLATPQLTLTIPVETVSGEHPFTVIAIPDSGETKQLKLILNVEPIDLVVTTLTLILQPTEAPFMGEVSALGQLTALSDTPVKLDDAVIQIIFTAPGGKIYTHEATTDAEGSYQLPAPFLPKEVGEWSVKTQFDGNEQLKSSERERFFTVMKAQAEIVFDTGAAGTLGTEIMILGRLEPQLEDELISLKILRPDGSASTLAGIITTEALGVFRYLLNLDMAGDWGITATWPGDDNYEAVTRTLVISVGKEMSKAIIVLGGGNKENNPAWKTFNRVAEYVHGVFRRRNFHDDDDIYFLSPDLKATEGADHETSIAELESAITNWAAERVNAQVPLYLYLLSHNLGHKFLLEKSGNHETYLTPAQLDQWLDQLPEGVQVTIIIEACYSGNFIRTPDGRATALVDPDRTIITSARGDKQAKILPNRSSFSKAFFDRIGANKPLGEAFREAELFMERVPFHRDQFPQMDADGDGKINTPQDYAEVAHRYFPADMISLAHPPEIIGITPSQALSEGVASLSIYAELLGVDITSVSATVIPPDFDPAKEVSDWSALSFAEFELAETSVEDNRHEYSATYADFTIPGDYTVIVSAENPDGSADPVQTTITVPGGLKGDINDDGQVDARDALLALRIAADGWYPPNTRNRLRI